MCCLVHQLMICFRMRGWVNFTQIQMQIQNQIHIHDKYRDLVTSCSCRRGCVNFTCLVFCICILCRRFSNISNTISSYFGTHNCEDPSVGVVNKGFWQVIQSKALQIALALCTYGIHSIHYKWCIVYTMYTVLCILL